MVLLFSPKELTWVRFLHILPIMCKVEIKCIPKEDVEVRPMTQETPEWLKTLLEIHGSGITHGSLEKIKIDASVV